MFKAGAAETVINPPLGTSLGGYFYERPCMGILDDLHAKALVLDDGTTKVAIAICDLQAIESTEVNEARRIASQATGIPAENIMISTTHTHTGPQVRRHRVVPVNDDYLAVLPGMIADAITRAHANLQTATVRLGEEHEDRLAFNRRFRMSDGRVVFNPRKCAEGILGADGPIDPQINVLRLDGEDGQPICILANYQMHPDVMGGCEASADFPGVASRIVSSLYESNPVVIYMQGACGNINQRDVSDPRPQTGPEEVLKIGRALAGKILAASELSVPVEGTLVRTSRSMLDIKYHPLTDELRAKADRVLADPNAGDFDRAQAEAISRYQLDGKSAEVEVQVIRVGDTAFVGIPGEYFVEYGISIKEWSPFGQTFVAELANNTFGYIPTLDAFHPGTYETMPIVSATLDPSAGVQMANAAGRLLRSLASD